MKFRTTLAALAAVATLSLAACGSDDAAEPSSPAASPPVASAPAESDAMGSEDAGSDAAGSEAMGSESAGSEAMGSEDAGSEAMGSEDAGSEAAGSDAVDSAMAAAPEGCKAAIDIVQGLPDLMTGLTSGEPVTQEAVDAAFPADKMNQLPEELVEPIGKVKDLANQLVGKSPADAAPILQELGTEVSGLSSQMQSACTS